MNRSNVGNVVTNGVQILSVGATTATRYLGKAESALNNLTDSEKSDYYQMKANKMRDETKDYNNKKTNSSVDNIMTKSNVKNDGITNNELSIENNDTFNDIDSLMSNNSPQVESIQKKINNDNKFLAEWKGNYLQEQGRPVDAIISEKANKINKGEN